MPIIFGTAPVNMAADPQKATNKLFLCNTFAEAQAAVGYSDDYENYTLCQAMDAFFKVFKIGPVVICNVLDPAKHKTEYTETITVVGEQAVSTKKGVMLNNLKVTDGSSTALVKDTDYTVEFNEDGYVVVTVIKEAVSSVQLTGTAIDPSAVTDKDIIGSYDASTGKETGIELARRVFPMFGVRVNFLLAPGWSQMPSVGMALMGKEEKLSGLFKCRAVLDIDTKKATKYTDVEKVKKDSGYSSNDICLWPMVSYGGKTMYYSAIYAAMTCLLDYNNGSIPNISPSNEDIKISAAVLHDGISGSHTLPNFDAVTETMSGAGVLGEYETGVVGNYSSMEQELAFRTLESDMFNLMDPTQPVDITFRASQQSTVKSSGALDYVSMRIVERGRFKSFEPGKIERGKQMEAKLKFELFYILIEIDGNTVIEYDKLNSVFTVNGKDLLEKVRSQC